MKVIGKKSEESGPTESFSHERGYAKMMALYSGNLSHALAGYEYIVNIKLRIDQDFEGSITFDQTSGSCIT